MQTNALLLVRQRKGVLLGLRRLDFGCGGQRGETSYGGRPGVQDVYSGAEDEVSLIASTLVVFDKLG